jgi:ferredoxin
MNNVFKNISIIYFSGTGGTEKAAFLAKEYLVEKNKTVEIQSLNKNYLINAKISIESTDLIILLYPVYAFDAPQIIYDWCKVLPKGKKVPVVIVSVSGGGEIWLNNACRVGIINKLRKRNFFVIYEKMIEMPSNFIVETPEEKALFLIKELPKKIKTIINEVLFEKKMQRKPEFGGRIITFIFKVEKILIWILGKSLKINWNCSKCNLCINNCPKNNIVYNKSKIQFENHCEGCLKCIYNCPNKAIYSKIFSFVFLKNGYSIKSYEEKISLVGDKNQPHFV